LPNLKVAAISEELDRRSDLLKVGVNKAIKAQGDITPYKGAQLVYQHGAATLHSSAAGGIPVLMIPSHINKGYIMDLMPEHSLLEALQQGDICPYLLEWNQPNQVKYDESDYMQEILIPMLKYIYNRHQAPVYVLGYCMGGLLATALAQLSPQMVRGLITIATPWNFHADSFPYRLTEATYNMIINNLNGDYVSKEIISAMLQWPQLNITIDKLISLGEKGYVSPLFIAVENWLDDGLNMTIPLFNTCMRKFSLLNQPYKGEWEVMGRIIDPKAITIPVLSVIASKDNVVPPSAATPLSALFPNCEVYEVDTGHLGAIISKNHCVGPKLCDWISSLR